MKAWERLEEVIKWTGLSTHAFAMELGMKRSENLYRVRREKSGVSSKLAEVIVQRYPEINLSWLFSGEGQMFNSEKPITAHNKSISFYEDLKFMNEPIFRIESTILSDCDVGVILDNDAMSPIVAYGSYLFLKKADKNNIVYGQLYYFQYKGIYLLRYMRKGDENQYILSAINKDKYDDIEVSKEDISSLYIVRSILNKLI
ncbi:MAG: S24 family peptidase [Rikenellaceae bacterium]